MKKEMLINVLQPEECRIAIIEDGVLEELYVERTSHESYTGNIYKGRIVNLEPAIQAAFVDFSVGRNGFLHVSDVEPQYFERIEDAHDEIDRILGYATAIAIGSAILAEAADATIAGVLRHGRTHGSGRRLPRGRHRPPRRRGQKNGPETEVGSATVTRTARAASESGPTCRLKGRARIDPRCHAASAKAWSNRPIPGSSRNDPRRSKPASSAAEIAAGGNRSHSTGFVAEKSRPPFLRLWPGNPRSATGTQTYLGPRRTGRA